MGCRHPLVRGFMHASCPFGRLPRICTIVALASVLALSEHSLPGSSLSAVAGAMQEGMADCMTVEINGQYGEALQCYRTFLGDESASHTDAELQQLEEAIERTEMLHSASKAGAFVTLPATAVIDGTALNFSFSTGDDFEEFSEGVCLELSDNKKIQESLVPICMDAIQSSCLERELQHYQSLDGTNNDWVQRPPRGIPSVFEAQFTKHGAIPVLKLYRDDSFAQYYRSYSQWAIDAMVKRASKRLTGPNYADVDRLLYEATAEKGSIVRQLISGARVVVFGSVVPWYEAWALANGASHVTTIEYNELQYKHPQISTRLVTDSIEPGSFDVGLCISSFEHDGLGRYGDPIDPSADLKAMQSASSMIKSGGAMLLALPMGNDVVAWNVHRVYGPERLPEFLSGWTVQDSWGVDRVSPFNVPEIFTFQPLLLLRNLESLDNADEENMITMSDSCKQLRLFNVHCRNHINMINSAHEEL